MAILNSMSPLCLISFCVLYLFSLYHYISLYLCCALYRRVSQLLGPQTDFIELTE